MAPTPTPGPAFEAEAVVVPGVTCAAGPLTSAVPATPQTATSSAEAPPSIRCGATAPTAPAALTKVFLPTKLRPRSTAIVVRVRRSSPALAATWLDRLRSWRVDVIAVRWQPRFPHSEGAR